MVHAKAARPKQIVIAISIIILMALPVLRLPLAHATQALTVEVKDVNQDSFPDVEFHFTDANGNPLSDVLIGLTPWNGSQGPLLGKPPLFSGSTNASGFVLFKTIPANNYTISHGAAPLSKVGNTTLIADTLTIPPDKFSFALTDEESLLVQAIAIESMGSRTDKGRALLEGLANLTQYSLTQHPLPPQNSSDNYFTSKAYVAWLGGFLNNLDSSRKIMPPDVWSVVSKIVAVYMGVLDILGMYSLDALVPYNLSLFGPEQQAKTDYLIGADHAFTVREKATGILYIFWGISDLFVLYTTGNATAILLDSHAKPISRVSIAVRTADDFSKIVLGGMTLAVATGHLRAISGWNIWAGRFAALAAIAVAIVQAWSLADRYNYTWGPFIHDLTDPAHHLDLWVQVVSIAGALIFAVGLLAFGALAKLTLAGFLLGVAADIAGLILLYLALNDYYNKIASMRSTLTGQLSSLYRVRDTLWKIDTDLLRQQGTFSASLAGATAHVAASPTTTSQFKDDFLWLNYYFSRLSSAQLGLANSVENGRQKVDDLLRTFLYSSSGGKTFGGYLEGYNSTKAEFAGSKPSFTFNATIYGIQSDGTIGFRRHKITADNLNGTFTTQPDLSNVVTWAFQPKNESDGRIGFLPTYVNTTIAGNQQPFSGCGQQQFCFLGQSDSTIVDNDVYAGGSRLVLDEGKRTQSFFVYKFFINDTVSPKDCLLGPLPFVGCLQYGTYNGMQAWVDNLNAKVPLVQNALAAVSRSLDEYNVSSNLKRGLVFPRLPLADPGPDRTVEGNAAGGADVQLDASRSFDPSGGTLTNYTWTGDFVGGRTTDVMPTVHLSLGRHVIQLIVGSGMNYSFPSSFTVTVVHTTPPILHIMTPEEGSALQDGVVFTIGAQDIVSQIASVTLSIRDVNGSAIGFEGLPAIRDSSGMWKVSFNTRLLPDEHYAMVAIAIDDTGLRMSTTASFSIRNWVGVELLPSSTRNQAVRTMPVKFSMRVNATVDPNQPFVYNEQLTIRVYASSSFTLLQESIFGAGSVNYRISNGGKLYITNFKTSKQPMQYTVVVLRGTVEVGSFTFTTT